MDKELQRLETSFNNRAEQWISKQGLLFQFTHNTGSGSMLPKICGLLFRLLILCIIALVVFWFYLSKRPSSETFKEDVQQQVAKGLNAGEVEISGIRRDKGGMLTSKMLISTLALGETESSFFENWHEEEEDVSVVGHRTISDKKKTAVLHGIKLSPLGIRDNYFSTGWSAKEMSITKAVMKLKTGADTDAEARDAYSSLFKSYDTLKIDSIQIIDAILLWGHSETSSGSIKGAELEITKRVDSWEINITGGTFSHSWLKNAKINKMKVICKSSDEVVIESASLSLGDGELSFNASIQIKAQPELTGNYSFDDIKVKELIGNVYEDWLEGNISGTGELAGKLNSAEGVKVTTTVNLAGKSKEAESKGAEPESGESKKESIIVIRGDKFPLLRTMQMKNPRNSYSLLRAHKGTLIIENQGYNTEVTVRDVRCGVNDLILMKGKFDYSVRTAEAKEEEIDNSSLKMRESEKALSEGDTDELAFEEVADTVRAFSGELDLGLVSEVFENNIKVLDVYPVDAATLRVWLKVELKGQIEDLTSELADELFDIMKDDENN